MLNHPTRQSNSYKDENPLFPPAFPSLEPTLAYSRYDCDEGKASMINNHWFLFALASKVADSAPEVGSSPKVIFRGLGLGLTLVRLGLSPPASVQNEQRIFFEFWHYVANAGR